jgi:hypothetical protein
VTCSGALHVSFICLTHSNLLVVRLERKVVDTGNVAQCRVPLSDSFSCSLASCFALCTVCLRLWKYIDVKLWASS